MNEYEKWGRSFIDSLLRHVGTSLTIWGATEIKYKEVNFMDLGMFILVGAVIPTIAEFFKQGLPPEVTETTTTLTVKETKPAEPVVPTPPVNQPTKG